MSQELLVKKLFCARQILFSFCFLAMPLGLLAQVPQSNHVVVVVEENHSYSSVVGNASMPYLNGLAQKYSLLTQYYANTHPSIGNYFMMTTGQIITNSDGYTGTVTANNIVRQLLTGGKTWKSYAEGLPSVGYIGGNTGSYVRHHNPFTYFSDVVNSSVQKLNLVPFTRFAADLTNNQLPDFSFIVPNLNDDAHNGTLAQADGWLKTNIDPLLSNPEFQQDGILIIVFDEAASTDSTLGGGHIAAIVAGPGVRKGFKSTTVYQHQSLLRTVLDAVGVHSYPGAAATAKPISEAFTSSAAIPTPTPSPSDCSASTIGVTVCSPSSGATLTSPVRFRAAAKSTHAITGMRIYVDNVSKYLINASTLDSSLAISAGTHSAVVQAWDSSGAVFKTALTIKVQ